MVSSRLVLCVMSADKSSSVAVGSCIVSSSVFLSSYPDRDTLALASKNCFQNYRELTRLFMVVYAGDADLGTFPDISRMLGILFY